MRQNQVKIGEVYLCKVGRNTAQVRIQKSSPKGGWDGTLLSTGKPIAIRDAKRLLGPAPAQERKEQQPKAPGPKGLSCLSAAAQVLGKTSEALTCGQMIEAMREDKLWSSASGKTPANTLYSAILREIKIKGEQARFSKAGRGKFALAG